MQIEKYDIRPIGVVNVPEYADVIRRSFATVAHDFGWTRENAPGHVSFLTDEQLQQQMNNHETFGFCVDGKIVGFVALKDLGDGVFELRKISILPECRHYGYGKKLLDFCKTIVKEHGGRKVILDIIEENTILKEWYTANGFVHIGTKKFEHLPFTTGYMEYIV